jgi:hypothetical protein
MSKNRAQRTLRYFVRSYVTKPTTINAMTDIPAKIPRPIGSTEIFFPGIWKAAWAVPEGEEEALSAAVTAGVPLLAVEIVVAGVEVGDGEVVGLVDVVVDEEEVETGVLERETEVKIFDRCYHSKNNTLAPGTHYSRRYRGRR